MRGAHHEEQHVQIRPRPALAIAISALAAPVVSAATAEQLLPNVTSQTAQASDGSGVVVRRDGSQASPLVADVGPEVAATSDGFDWGDAGIGATAMLALAAIAAGTGLVLGRRPSRSHTPRSATPRSATSTLAGRG